MREIKFRGKTLVRWVTGNLSILPKDIYNGIKAGTYISNKGDMPFAYAVRPETVGQWTGLVDINGKDIFEGDIVQGVYRFGNPFPLPVVFKDGAFGVEETCLNGFKRFQAFTSFFNVQWEVIGNIYDKEEFS